jgi:hypothetical protein
MGVARRGRNVIAIRVWDRTGDGGLTGSPEQLRLVNTATGESIPLAGEAAFRAERTIPLPALNYFELMQKHRPYLADSCQHPTKIFNGMIAPLAPMSLSGVIWYQGESNAGEAAAYTRLMPALIADWRQNFLNRELGFFYVQLANYGAPADPNLVSEWALLREAQRSALSVPGSGMVVTIDVGDPLDIHPRNKRAVGERLADHRTHLDARQLHVGAQPHAVDPLELRRQRVAAHRLYVGGRIGEHQEHAGDDEHHGTHQRLDEIFAHLAAAPFCVGKNRDQFGVHGS